MADPSLRPPVARTQASTIELVGLPGSGKTTIAEALQSRADLPFSRVSAGEANAIALARSAWAVAIPFLHQWPRLEKGRRRRRFRAMLSLEALGELVDRSRERSRALVLLDQGPVYLLSILQRTLEAGRKSGNSAALEAYWEAKLCRWAARLDHIFKLEASHDVLYRRILERDKRHLVGRMSRADAALWFERFRISQERIISSLQARHEALRVVCVPADQLGVEDTVERVLAQLELPGSAAS